MTALAHQLARLIGPLHGVFLRFPRREGCAANLGKTRFLVGLSMLSVLRAYKGAPLARECDGCAPGWNRIVWPSAKSRQCDGGGLLGMKVAPVIGALFVLLPIFACLIDTG